MLCTIMMCQLPCRLNVKNVKEREAKLARLGQAIQERHQQNTKLLKVSCILAAKRPHMVHNSVWLQIVHNAMIQWHVLLQTNWAPERYDRLCWYCMNPMFDLAHHDLESVLIITIIMCLMLSRRWSKSRVSWMSQHRPAHPQRSLKVHMPGACVIWPHSGSSKTLLPYSRNAWVSYRRKLRICTGAHTLHLLSEQSITQMK